MGKIEEESKIRTRKTKIKMAILTTLLLGIAGTLNPKMLVRGVLKELKTPKEKRRQAESAIYAARGRLIKEGLIEYDGNYWQITATGKTILERIKQKENGLPKPKRWDKKWRVLIFDIQENKKGLREKVRNTLIAVGFKRLQDSVWVYPYDCEDFIALVKTDFKIGKDLIYIIADAIENDAWLRKQFEISL